MKAICPHCHKEYTLGVDGIVTGCDACKKVTRANGYAFQDEHERCSCFEIVGDDPTCEIHGERKIK